MKEITQKEQALISLGKVNGWVDFMPQASSVRYSLANLAFAFAEKSDIDLESALNGRMNDKNYTRFTEVFLSPTLLKEDFCNELQSVHRHIFSQTDGYEFHPGEWKNTEAVGELHGAIEAADENESIFGATQNLVSSFNKLMPFKSGNEVILQLVPNLYLMRRGYIRSPIFILDQSKKTSDDAVTWFQKNTQLIIEAMQCVERLQAEYQERIAGMSKQRKTLFEDLLPFMMKRPTFTVRQLQTDYEPIKKITYQTLNELLKELARANIVKESTGQARHRVFHLHEYTKIFKPFI